MTLQEMATLVVEFVHDNKAWAVPVTFLLAFGESIAFVSLILPFWGMLVGIGALVGVGSPEFWTIWIAASLGAAAGDWASYWLGGILKDDAWRLWPLSRYPQLRPAGHAFFERYGVWAIAIGRFSGPLRASVPLVAGILKMPWLAFQIANVLSAFVWAGVLLVFGDGVGRLIALIRDWMATAM